MTIIGIDLGTTNSACAVWKNGKVEQVPNQLGNFLTPSVINISSDNTISVGKIARERHVTQAQSTASLFKRYMGSDRTIRIHNKEYSAPELSSFVLQSLKQDAELFLGEEVNQAIISVPAYFSDVQRKATILAGELAGLNVERLINEPTAAAMSYGLHNKPEHTQFMVLDLGGGTFDVSIMEYFEGVLEVHASSGDNFLGGEDFLEILVNKFLSMLNLTKNHVHDNDLQKIYMQMEQVKRKFNGADIVQVEPFLKDQPETISIRRDEYIQLAAPLLARIQRPIETALRDADLVPSDLDDVILVGGATRMQFFRSMVAKLFRRMPSTSLDPDLVISMGAAIQAGLFAKDEALDDIVLTDVCPYSLGTGTLNESDPNSKQGDLFSAIIERNTVIPTSRSSTYWTTANNQTYMDIDLYQGESRLVNNNIKLGSVKVPIPKAKKGEESADVRFTYDMNGILEVDITVVSTGQTYYHMIQNAPGELSDDEISASKAKLAQLKFHPREEATNQELIARAERLFESHLGAIRDHIQETLNYFESVLDNQVTRDIEKAAHDFNIYLEGIESDNFF